MMRIINPENIGLVASLALVLDLGGFGLKAAAAAETPKRGTVSECLPVLAQYQQFGPGPNILVKPEPGKNEQYYLLTQRPNFTIEILQKSIKKETTIESEVSVNTKTIATDGRVEVDFKDAAPNIFMEFDIANLVSTKGVTTNVSLEVCRTLS